jgi:hypothetical protein
MAGLVPAIFLSMRHFQIALTSRPAGRLCAYDPIVMLSTIQGRRDKHAAFITGYMSPFTRLLRPYGLYMRQLAWRAVVGRLDPPAYEFYANMLAAGYDPSAAIDVLPAQRIIYINVPKAASSRIKMCLSGFLGRQPATSEAAHSRRQSGLKAPHHVGLSTFYRLVRDPGTLNFSFVRNPYARLVSCWADKFRDRPLVAGDAFVDLYLAWREKADPRLPAGAGATLSFADFAGFAAATAAEGLNAHWQIQRQLVDAPGIDVDFVGKIESFDRDFRRVYEHVGIASPAGSESHAPVRATSHRPWRDYYTPDLAELVYRAYERDFDRFGYPRALPD